MDTGAGAARLAVDDEGYLVDSDDWDEDVARELARSEGVALTDERVRYRRAPFDHPQLFVPNGHQGDHMSSTDADGDGRADDRMIEIRAVGADGGPPLPGFLEGIFGPTDAAVSPVSLVLWQRPGGGIRANRSLR